ncbi:BZ3500_MvSof-1268-A1-R1_Chr11-1g03160 [Microbotryum saponariae]|uniref:BZ3500_MvSof-1268-A1-R1_Chr11-1g03160 protein n=1 Tax=Microbotryum saponariae TaxID=289078 RepID=A0A2X0L7S0_9BASI|nr:BZ3501_MvSof-1269-A2-R1_Chr11g02735 [Microbotryum saponariae]SDA03720.1 BZ3500_MvSof-1268-A1-R1_Chr11-1g03160 [Microbotryum saponariae]
MGTHSVELTLNKTNIAQSHSYPPFRLVNRVYGSYEYTSTITISWVPGYGQFSIIDEPSNTGHSSSILRSLLPGPDATLGFEVTSLTRAGEHGPYGPPHISWEGSLNYEAISRYKWTVEASHLIQILEDTPGQTLNLLLTISIYHRDSKYSPACIGKRLQDYERCLIASEQTKAELAGKLQESREACTKTLITLILSTCAHSHIADARLKRHLHDLRFIFRPSNRILYENAQYLRSKCSYFDDLLSSTFNEAQKRVVGDEETWSDSTMPLASEPSSITCHVPIHTIVIDEERSDTYASYNTVLDWVHCQQATFGSVEISRAEVQAHPLEAPLQNSLVDDSLDKTSERGSSLPPTTPTVPSAEGVYRLCDRLGLSELRNFAFGAFKSDMTSSQAPYLLFSTFSCDFKEVAEFCIEYCATHWSEVDQAPEMEHIRSLIEQDQLAIGAAEGARLLSRLFVRVMSKNSG